MAANLRTYGNFVPCPKVIVVKWISENPEYFRNDQDPHDYQVWKFTCLSSRVEVYQSYQKETDRKDGTIEKNLPDWY